MEQFNEQYLFNLSRPKITIDADCILIFDRPFAWKIFLSLFCLLMAFIVFESNYESRTIGLILTISISIGFIYDSLSLKRTKIDLKNKIIYTKSLNPVDNILGRILKHPSQIPFSAIEKVFTDHPETFASAPRRYYLYIRTDDPYNLNIGTFNKLVEAEHIAAYLNRKVKA